MHGFSIAAWWGDYRSRPMAAMWKRIKIGRNRRTDDEETQLKPAENAAAA
jgi:hypothetical protein